MRFRQTTSTFLALAAFTALMFARVAAAAPAGLLKLPDFDSLANKASQSVDITLDTTLLGLAASFLDAGKPEEAATREVIRGLKGIYVRSYTFDKDFAYPVTDVETVRKQLAAPGWEKLVKVRDNREHSHVDIYICLDQGRASGLAIIASEPRSFTIVNIVGAIDLQKLHALEGKFGIPQMQLDQKN
jgi:Domain of unknown function (DUF4252)